MNYSETLDYIANVIYYNTEEKSKKTFAKINHGLALLLGLVISTAFTVALSYPLDIAKQTLQLLILTLPLKSIIPGYHYRSEMGCFIATTVPIYLAAYLINLNPNLPSPFWVLMLVMTTLHLVSQESSNRGGVTNISKENLNNLKLLRYLIIVLYIIIMPIIYNIQYLVLTFLVTSVFTVKISVIPGANWE